MLKKFHPCKELIKIIVLSLEKNMIALLVAAVGFSAAIADPMTAVQLQPR